MNRVCDICRDAGSLSTASETFVVVTYTSSHTHSGIHHITRHFYRKVDEFQVRVCSDCIRALDKRNVGQMRILLPAFAIAIVVAVVVLGALIYTSRDTDTATTNELLVGLAAVGVLAETLTLASFRTELSETGPDAGLRHERLKTRLFEKAANDVMRQRHPEYFVKQGLQFMTATQWAKKVQESTSM